MGPDAADIRTTVSRNWSALSVVERAYLLGRVGITVVLVAFVAAGAVREAHGAGGVASAVAFWIGFTLMVLTSMYSSGAMLLAGRPGPRVIWEVIAFDLAAAGLLVWALGPVEDPMYPWLLGIAICTANVANRRLTWVVAGLAAAVYLLAHLAGHAGAHAATGVVVLVYKASAIVFSGWVVAASMQMQSERDQAILEERRKAEDLNVLLARRLSELRAISEITEMIHSTLDFEQIGALVLDTLSKVLGVTSSCLFVVDKEKAETLFSASSGGAPGAWRSYGERASLGESRIEGESDGDPFACFTVLDHKDMIVVFCAAASEIEQFGDEDRLVLQAVGSELLVAVENSRLYKLTKRLSITDDLTGLYNYRYLQQRLEDEVERSRRYGRPLSLLMLDADDFKLFNDTNGHVAGDVALTDLGGVLRRAVREIDVVCRYGGEEFAVVLPETDAEGAFVVAEKVRESVSQHLFDDAAGVSRIHMTVSIGLATLPTIASDREELLRYADAALYEAKHGGRDRVRTPQRAPSPMEEQEDAATGGGPGTRDGGE